MPTDCLLVTHFWAAHCAVHAIFQSSSHSLQFLLAFWPNQSQLQFPQLPIWMVSLLLVFPIISSHHLQWIQFHSSWSLFCKKRLEEKYFPYLVVTVSFAGFHFVPELFFRPALPLYLLLSFHCLFQPPWVSSHHLLSLWKGHLCPARTNFLQLPLARASCRSTSATSVLSSHSSWKSLLQGIGDVRHFC